MVLGCPRPTAPDPIRNRYLIWHAQRLGIPVCATLPGTVDTAPSSLRISLRA